MNYVFITNNPLLERKTDNPSIDIKYYDESVPQIILRTIGMFQLGGWELAADPMGGRRARPFPVLTVILKQSGIQYFREEDMLRMEDYKMLDRKRADKYQNISPKLLNDYRILDKSLSETALNGILQHLLVV